MKNNTLPNNQHQHVIDIIGAGAIGLLFAAKLKLAGHKVRLWCRTALQADQLKAEGFLFEEKLESGQLVSSYSEWITLDEVYVFDSITLSYLEKAKVHQTKQQAVTMTIITIKQSSFEPTFLNHLAKYNKVALSSSYIFIQNGIGHLEKVKAMLEESVIVQAVTSEAALRQEHGVIHTGNGQTYLSAVEKDDRVTKIVEECFNNAGILSFVSKTINEYVYRKLIVNAVINPLTALFRVKNGLLPLQPARLQLMERVYEEAKAIIEQASGAVLHISFDDIVLVCEKTANNQSSMLTDVLNGRITEIEAINGAIVKLAEKHNLQAPINETVYLLVLAQHP